MNRCSDFSHTARIEVWTFTFTCKNVFIKLIKAPNQCDYNMDIGYQNPYRGFADFRFNMVMTLTGESLCDGTSNLPRIPCMSIQWRHNEHDGVSNHRCHDCLLNRLFRHRSKKTWKLRVTCLCDGNSPMTGEFPEQTASNVKNVSIWWRHHGNREVLPATILLSQEMLKAGKSKAINAYTWRRSGVTVNLLSGPYCVGEQSIFGIFWWLYKISKSYQHVSLCSPTSHTLNQWCGYCSILMLILDQNGRYFADFLYLNSIFNDVCSQTDMFATRQHRFR